MKYESDIMINASFYLNFLIIKIKKVLFKMKELDTILF